MRAVKRRRRSSRQSASSRDDRRSRHGFAVEHARRHHRSVSERADSVKLDRARRRRLRQRGRPRQERSSARALDTRDLEAQLAVRRGHCRERRRQGEQTYDQADLTIVQNNNTVNSAQAAVRSAQSTLGDGDRLNLKRDAELLKSGYISQQTYDAQNVDGADRRLGIAQRAVTYAKRRQASAIQRHDDIRFARRDGRRGARRRSRPRWAKPITCAPRSRRRRSFRRSTAWSSIAISIPASIPARDKSSRCRNSTKCTPCSTARVHRSSACASVRRPRSRRAITPSSRPPGKVIGVLDEVTPGSTNFIVKALLPNPAEALSTPAWSFRGASTRPTTTGIRMPRHGVRRYDRIRPCRSSDNGQVKTVAVTMIADDGKNAIVTGCAGGPASDRERAARVSDGQNVEPQKNAVAER